MYFFSTIFHHIKNIIQAGINRHFKRPPRHEAPQTKALAVCNANQNVLLTHFPLLVEQNQKLFQENPQALLSQIYKSINEILWSHVRANVISAALMANEEKIADLPIASKKHFYTIAVASGHFQYSKLLDHHLHSLQIALTLCNVDAFYHSWGCLTQEERIEVAVNCLIPAIKTANLPLVKFIIEEGEIFFPHHYDPDSAMMSAIEKNDIEMVKYLLSLKANFKFWHWLMGAAYQTKNFEMVGLLKNSRYEKLYWRSRKKLPPSLSPVSRTIKTLVNYTPHILTLIQIAQLNKNQDALSKYYNVNTKFTDNITQTGFPQAVIARAVSKSTKDKIADLFFTMIYPEKLFLGNLARYFQIHDRQTPIVADICKLIRDAKEFGPVVFFMFKGHGNTNIISLGGHQAPEAIIVYDLFNKELRSLQDLSCLSELATGAIIVLESCNTGSENFFYFSDLPHLGFNFNIHRLMAMHAPGSTVFSAEFYMIRGSTSISFSPELKVYGNGFSAQTWPTLIYGFLKQYLSHYAPANTLHSAYSPQAEQLKIISGQHAEFCKEVIPYSIMNRYCDAIPLKPSAQAIAACMEDESCKKGFNNLMSHFKKPIANNTIFNPNSVKPHTPLEPSLFTHGWTSIGSAFTTAWMREHCKYQHYSKFKSFMITQGTMAATQLCIAPKASSILSLVTSISLNFVTEELSFKGYLPYATSALYLGYYSYSCFYYPEQMASTLTEFATTVTGTIIGNKLGQYAYHLYLKRQAAKETNETEQAQAVLEADYKSKIVCRSLANITKKNS
ncbi:MAG: hypothetical protein JSS07_00620 [Proteobacteria bacterium]|nr:hypothetical protein [Pseudomonadota bacterium]